MRYSAASIANAFLSRGFRDGRSISPMKIQKLAYLAHGHTLVECPEPLLDEVFEAWKFGPVLPSLYHECKKYGQKSVEHYLEDYDFATNKSFPAPQPSEQVVIDIIDFVWEAYGDQPAISLSDWTHAKGGPWDRVTNGGAVIIRNRDIPDDLIKIYFEENLYAGGDLFEKKAPEEA
jgi:uncharacterized phage-associated protein